jgi:predicted alpha/beta superfamily hydrolase
MIRRDFLAGATGSTAVLLASACATPRRPGASRPSTAGPGVSVLDEAFAIPQLGRTRTVRLYLPPGYEGGTQRHPVLYFLDGQNVFDAATSFAGEWNADETLSRIASGGGPQAIAVAIDNGGQLREDEYHQLLPDDGAPGHADQFVAFLAETLKPHIDARLRTLTGPEATGIIGASSGATLALHAGFTRPDVFGRIGAFSTPLWLEPKPAEEVLRLRPARDTSRIALVTGALETVWTLPPGTFARDIPAMQQALEGAGYRADQLDIRVVPDGLHREWFWARELESVVRFLLA